MKIQSEILVLQGNDDKKPKNFKFLVHARFKGAVKKVHEVDIKDKILDHVRDEIKTREDEKDKSGPFAHTNSPEYFENKFNYYQLDNQSKQTLHREMLIEVDNKSIIFYS